MAVTLPRQRADATKKRQPPAPDGSKTHEAAESKAMEQEEEASGTDEPGEEGPGAMRRGSMKDAGGKPDYRGRPKPSRARSAPGSKNTKAPMDSDCGCGGQKKGGCSCGSSSRGKSMKDSSCGARPMKDGDTSRGPGELYGRMSARRGDSLPVHDYLRACELGIQNQPTAYILARLDASERLDLKCGNGAIRQGQKCTKGTAQQAAPVGYANTNGRPLSHGQIRQIERNIIQQEARTGKKVKMSPEQAALLIQTPGTNSRKFVASQLRGATTGELKSAISASETSSDPLRQAARRVAKRELFNRRVQRGVHILGAGLALGAVAASTAQTRRRDSIWAQGFQP